jgi:hypothetical protein
VEEYAVSRDNCVFLDNDDVSNHYVNSLNCKLLGFVIKGADNVDGFFLLLAERALFLHHFVALSNMPRSVTTLEEEHNEVVKPFSMTDQ